jgi:hypothetical protein
MSQTLFSKPPGVNATQIGTATTTLIKNGPGQISSVMVGTAQASATMSVYDGLDATGTLMGKVELDIMGQWTPPAPLNFAVGLCVVTTGLTTGSVTFLWT